MYNINPTNLLCETGETTRSSEGYRLFSKQLGNIEITSGRIVACDPFVSEGYHPFSMKVHTGKYPILLMVKRLESGDERVAYAMIKFTNEQTTEWELATRAGQELKNLKKDEFFGYGVNTGMGVSWMRRQHFIFKLMRISDIKRTMIFIFTRNLQKRLSKTISTHGIGSSPVFMTRWTLPCLPQATVTECNQAFGGWMKTENLLAL
ncbi:DUF4241 domain-containing protein [Bacillus pumilus]|nr:DUF4241 domain-containing protein [Bacillus pumilus]